MAEQRITHTVVFFDEDTNDTIATVTVFTVLENDGTTCDAIQIAATARKSLTNASARVLDPDTGREIAAYGSDEIEEWWA
jgi:hypothetical protein